MLNPLRGSILIYSFASGFTGGYSDSSPSDFGSLKIPKGFNLNNRGCKPVDNGAKEKEPRSGFNK